MHMHIYIYMYMYIYIYIYIYVSGTGFALWGGLEKEVRGVYKRTRARVCVNVYENKRVRQRIWARLLSSAGSLA